MAPLSLHHLAGHKKTVGSNDGQVCSNSNLSNFKEPFLPGRRLHTHATLRPCVQYDLYPEATVVEFML